MTFIFLIVLSSILVSAYAIEAIVVDAGKAAQRTIDLVSGDNVTGTIICIDAEYGYNNTVDFWINRPDGSLIVNTRYRNTKGGAFSFIAGEDGVYTMWFANFDWLLTGNAVKVTLDYSINERTSPPNSISSDNTPYIIITIIASSLAVIFAILAFRRSKKSPEPAHARSTRYRSIVGCARAKTSTNQSYLAKISLQ